MKISLPSCHKLTLFIYTYFFLFPFTYNAHPPVSGSHIQSTMFSGTLSAISHIYPVSISSAFKHTQVLSKFPSSNLFPF